MKLLSTALKTAITNHPCERDFTSTASDVTMAFTKYEFDDNVKLP